ncbi:MAG: hypothetical protein M1833_001639 [Piccolia ochrophora]|nr:MAG: hypothetical protein M1833_001639 [Piccolia ochrophora]
MPTTPEQTALSTISLLETRLRRLEHSITGADSGDALPTKAVSTESITTRLASLEDALRRLSTHSKQIQDILSLHSRHPTFFDATSSPSEPPSALPDASVSSIVLASATLYPTTASRLTSIVDTPIPPAEASTSLIALMPRVARLDILQERQDRELADLRRRSAEVLERWYTVTVMGGGDCWAEWDDRCSRVEGSVRRMEARRAGNDEQ